MEEGSFLPPPPMPPALPPVGEEAGEEEEEGLVHDDPPAQPVLVCPTAFHDAPPAKRPRPSNGLNGSQAHPAASDEQPSGTSRPVDAAPDGRDEEMGEEEAAELGEEDGSECSDVDQLLEAPIDATPSSAAADKKKAQSLPDFKEKVVLKERSTEYFEVLPEGWLEVTHKSGMPVFLHKATRVCSFSRPYFLGPGSVRNHEVPLSAIPCLQQRRRTEEKEATAAGPDGSTPPKDQEAQGSDEATKTAANGKGDDDKPAASTEENKAPEVAAPTVMVQSAEDFQRRNLDPLQVREYCSSRFQFHTVRVLRFRSWAANRSFNRRRRMIKDGLESLKANGDAAGGAGAGGGESTAGGSSAPDALCPGTGRPSLPSGVRLITVPSMEARSKPQHKPFFINPQGKTPIAVLHEYVQKVLKGSVSYEFEETRKAATPYAATVRLCAGTKAKAAMDALLARLRLSREPGKDSVRLGRGLGNSKKMAKLEAAKAALELLMGEWEGKGKGGGEGAEASRAEEAAAAEKEAVALFDLLALDDGRVVEMSAKAGQPAPFLILQECLKRHSAFADTTMKTDIRRTAHQQHEYSLEVGAHKVTVRCSNKKEGKQKASQAVLAKLHPHLSRWGDLIRQYGYSAHRRLLQTRQDKDAIIRLQNSAAAAPGSAQRGHSEPNGAILGKLRQEMLKLSGRSALALPAPSARLHPHTALPAPAPPQGRPVSPTLSQPLPPPPPLPSFHLPPPTLHHLSANEHSQPSSSFNQAS